MSSNGNSSRVKVGVRVRPLLPKERHLQPILTSRSDDSVECKGQTFTYDFVFGTDLSQHDLYNKTAAPMLKNFLEGYNVTIMAYGQTGSGKTFTMGTSDLVNVEDPSMQGLIPRFVTDLFENMKQCGEGERLESKIKVSFCEIYGEDVFDLINSTTSIKQVERTSLAVREDENGHVFVQGQNEIEVSSSNEALDLLCLGSRNRITGSTAMNSGSSRSHAVFTITLDQTLQTSGTDIVQEDTHYMSSKLTFVDLAGSERIKRTGAEGQRLKEGIQINSGLFNLGQVINALADDQKIKQGVKATHVPYRNSKLTHLLKDALGGNSQTLFLACVSPAESNESETLSTLSYARQARNIQNKPVRNTDKTQQELRYLKYSVKTWMIKAITHMFSDAMKKEYTKEPMTPLPNELSPSKTDKDDIFQRSDVQEYIQTINKAIQEKIQGANPTPRKVRLSVVGPFLSPQRPTRGLKFMQELRVTDGENDQSGSMFDSIEPFNHRAGGRESILHVGNIQNVYEVPDPEETEKLVSRMLEMVSKEKDLSNFDAEDETEVADMEKQILEKEKILSTILETVKGYSTMKSDFEKLLGAIETLESERRELENELEKAKKASSDSKTGGSTASNPAIERIQERFKKVQDELKQMREERKCKENAYRLMQRESKQAESLQKELAKLKDAKVALLKQQKTQAAQYQKLKKDHTNKITALKKTDIKKQRQMNTLKSEIVKKDRVLGHKDRELSRINSKLRACEEHITQLLKIQNRNRQKILIKSDDKSTLPSEEQEHFQSSKSMLDNLVHDRVDAKRAKALCDLKSKLLRDLNKELVQEACEMEALLSKEKMLRGKDNDDDDDDEDEEMSLSCKTELLEVREAIRSVENNIDRITRELDIYNADLDELSHRIDDNCAKESKQRLCWDDLCKEIIAGFSVGQFQHLVWDLLNEKAEAMEEHFVASDALTQATTDCENAREKIGELEKQLAQLRIDTKIRLDKAESQRVQDIWALLKAQNAPSSTEITDVENDISTKISIQRAQELELEVENLVTNEEKLREENAELKQQLVYLQNEAYMQKARLRLDEAVVEETSDDQCFQVLGDVWSNLGLHANERDEIIESITKAASLAKAKAQTDAIHALEKTKVEVKNADQKLLHLCSALDVPISKYYSAKTNSVEVPLLDQLEMLKIAIEGAKAELQTKVNQVINLKERLLDLVSEMWLEMGELPMCLQVLMNISGADKDIDEFAFELYQLSIVLSDSTMSSWEKEMRNLNLTRASITNKLVALREDIVSRGSILGVIDKNYLHEIIAPNTLGPEITSDAIKAVVPLLLSTSNSNPPASSQLLAAMERVKVIFESIKANRIAVSKSVLKLGESLNTIFKDDKVVASLDDVENPSKDWLLSAFEVITFSSRVTQAKSKYCTQLIELMEEANYGTEDEREIRVQELIAATAEFLATPNLQAANEEYAKLDEAIEDLANMSIFFEEPWLCTSIKKISKGWNEKNEKYAVRELVQQVLLLRSENDRVQGLVESIREVKKLDSQLTKHVIDMEDFEIVSKQNRAALLSGNSKALVEEEKFRKNGKLKYESLSKKILAAVEKANNLSNCGNKCIIVPLDLSFVGTQTQLLLKGFKNERVELMHLHTTTHGKTQLYNILHH